MSVTRENKPKYNEASKRRFRFTRENRLLDADSFDAVFKKAHRSRDSLFTVLSRANGNKAARLGLAISRKHCRLAVQRNRLKRIVRESFRLHKEELRGIDVVVMCQRAAGRAGNRKLFDSLAGHWQRCRSETPSPDGGEEG